MLIIKNAIDKINIDIFLHLYYIISMKKISLMFLKFLAGFTLLYLASVFMNLFGMVIYALSILVIAVPVILNNAARFSLKKLCSKTTVTNRKC